MNLKGKNIVISIILPFQNEEAFLKKCVDSILAQTYPNWELILVDDHSTDASTAFAKEYAQSDARIQYFLNSGNGVIDALHMGFMNSTGALITRMDGDDIKSEDNLETLLHLTSPGTIGIGQVKYFREGGIGEGYDNYANWLNELTAYNRNFDEVYKECVVPSPCWLAYRDDLIRSGGFQSPYYPEDYDLCFRFYKAGLKTKGSKHIIHFWRDHTYRTTRTSEYYLDNRFMDLKLHYFNEIDYDASRELVLYGAGKKAKAVAQFWVDKGISFRWITNNPKKIGHNIYGVVLEKASTVNLSKENDVVVAIASKQYQVLRDRLGKLDCKTFWFC